MKRILLIITVVLLFATSCGPQSNTTEKQDIKINLPNNSSVNGYRLEGYSSPDLISQAEVGVSSNDNKTESYCGNKNSKIYHKSSCDSVSKMKDTNKVLFSTKQEYLQNGYKPCQKCNP